MTEESATTETAEDEREAPFWASFTRADMRVLVVTFAGTVAANVVTVLVVALAIISVGPLTYSPQTGSSQPRRFIMPAAILIVIGLLYVGVVAVLLRNPPPYAAGRGVKIILIGSFVFVGLCVAALLLVLLGIAAGVK